MSWTGSLRGLDFIEDQGHAESTLRRLRAKVGFAFGVKYFMFHVKHRRIVIPASAGKEVSDD